MKIHLNEEKEVLLKKNGKSIMDSDDKIIIYPFLYYSDDFDNYMVYDLFKKKYDNMFAEDFECTFEEANLAEKIIKSIYDPISYTQDYRGLCNHAFIRDDEFNYRFTSCKENESCIFNKYGEFYYCRLVSVTFVIDDDIPKYKVKFETEKKESKIICNSLNLPRLDAYYHHNSMCVIHSNI